MANVIEFYIPSSFHKRVKWTPAEQRGKVINFSVTVKPPVRLPKNDTGVSPIRIRSRWVRWP